MQVAVVHAVVMAPPTAHHEVHGRCVDGARSLAVSSRVAGDRSIEVTVEFLASDRPQMFARRVAAVQAALEVAIGRPVTWSPTTSRTL